VLAVNVEPTHVSSVCQRDKQGLLFQIPVRKQNADFPLLVGQAAHNRKARLAPYVRTQLR